MNKRYCKLEKYAAKAFFLFALSASFQACKDDYTLDDSNPSWLGSSIYEYLEEEGNYTNFVKLIDDLGYKEVLARTGSKTLFVADDNAFNEFYKSNPWGVRNYSELSLSQKKLLMNSAMINNAYLLEMMSNSPATGDDNSLPTKGETLRRETASDVTDSVSHVLSADIPHSYNTNDADYWARFRNSDKGIYMAIDATSPMMTHFLAAQMAQQKITDKDFEYLTGRTRDKNDAFIYDSKVTKADITCQNGYVNLLDRVLLFPQNMAEVLRTNDQTQIFSHMIDRFSAPFYNSTLTERYRLIYGNEVDSVFQKRYFADRSQGGVALYSDAGTDPTGNPSGNTVFNSNSNKPLPFDPGWNGYFANKASKEFDMAAIFCPTDEKLMEYFFDENGGGHFLVKAYAPAELVSQITPETKDMEKVYQAIDQIPRATIRALLNNLMKESFNATVPSKFEEIKNSTQDAMFDEKFDYHREKLLKTLLANNGVIYLMDEVTTPAEYAAVSAPAYVETDKRIFNWAVQSANLGGIPSNYYAYLLAMSSRFSFFVPSDDNFWYVDPLSFYAPTKNTGDAGATLVGRAYNYVWDEKKNTPKVTSYEYMYDCATGTGTIGELVATETVAENCFGNRLKDMLETHTIIHEDNSEVTGIDETATGVENAQQYYISKNGAVIKVDNAAKRKSGMTVQGGWQMANGEKSNVTGFDDKSAQTNGYGNGFAYMINQPLMPTIESVYSVMYNNPNFEKFFELCQTDDEVLAALRITSTTEKNKYQVFVNNKGLPCYDKSGNLVNSATNVRFFNNYRYTVYIPTNEAMEQAEKAGLPTWQELRDWFQLDIDPEDRRELTDEEEEKLIAKGRAAVTEIINFVKNHFQDNSIFADAPVRQQQAYETATIVTEETDNDEESTGGGAGVYSKVYVSSTGNGTLTVADYNHELRHVTSDKNIIARDYITKGEKSAVKNTIVSSSSAVIHGIDGVLNYRKLTGGRYDSAWSTTAKAKKFVKKYKPAK